MLLANPSCDQKLIVLDTGSKHVQPVKMTTQHTSFAMLLDIGAYKVSTQLPRNTLSKEELDECKNKTTHRNLKELVPLTPAQC